MKASLRVPQACNSGSLVEELAAEFSAEGFDRPS